MLGVDDGAHTAYQTCTTGKGACPDAIVDAAVAAASAAPLPLGAGARALRGAARALDHAVPIGPVHEKAWMVLNRISSKGATLPGYRGAENS